MLRNKFEEVTLLDLIKEIDNGDIFIPKFQRNYEWGIGNIKNLIDSILNNYLIGSLTLWETNKKLMLSSSILNQDLDKDIAEKLNNTKTKKSYLLDGQQRTTTIYALFKGLVVESVSNNKTEEIDFKKFRVTLADKFKVFYEEETSTYTKTEFQNSIPVYLLVQESHLLTQEEIQIVYGNVKGSMLGNILRTYSVGKITQIGGEDIETAITIFSRVNTTSGKLSDIDLFSAVTYREFQKDDRVMIKDFRDNLELIQERLGKNWSPMIKSERHISSTLSFFTKYVKWQNTQKNNTISLPKGFNTKYYTHLTKEELWENISLLEKTLADKIPVFFQHHYNIYNHKEIPSFAIFNWAFFFLLLFPKYSSEEFNNFNRYVTYALINNSFARATNDASSTFLKVFINYKETGVFNPKFESSEKELDKYIFLKDLLLNSHVQFLLKTQLPISLLTGNALNSLTSENNRQEQNVHHIFPKNWLKNNYNGEISENHAMNLVYVDATTNQKVIKDNAPSEYIPEISENRHFDLFMQKSLIDEKSLEKLLNDDYDGFIEKRAEHFIDTLKNYVYTTNKEKNKASDE